MRSKKEEGNEDIPETKDEEFEDDDAFGDDNDEMDDEEEAKEETSDDEKNEEADADLDNDNDNEDKESKADNEYNDKCIYNIAEESDEELDVVFDDDNDINQDTNIVPPEKRITKPWLTKYERVRLLGERTQQLTLGAKPMLKVTENLTPKEIAELEIKNNVLPLIIERPLFNGKKEHWKISELKH